jgi:hypothetical protein
MRYSMRSLRVVDTVASIFVRVGALWLLLPLLIVFGTSCRRAGPPPRPGSRPLVDMLQGEVRRISFLTRERRGSSDREVEIRDPAEIAEVLAQLVLAPKPACPCAHMESLTIETTEREYAASICDHCFNMQLEGGELFEMPPGFYAFFRKKLYPEGEERP